MPCSGGGRCRRRPFPSSTRAIAVAARYLREPGGPLKNMSGWPPVAAEEEETRTVAYLFPPCQAMNYWNKKVFGWLLTCATPKTEKREEGA